MISALFIPGLQQDDAVVCFTLLSLQSARPQQRPRERGTYCTYVQQRINYWPFGGCSQINTRVVVSGKTVTSRGPGTSLEFALTLVRCLFGDAKADEVAKPMVISEGLVY